MRLPGTSKPPRNSRASGVATIVGRSVPSSLAPPDAVVTSVQPAGDGDGQQCSCRRPCSGPPRRRGRRRLGGRRCRGRNRGRGGRRRRRRGRGRRCGGRRRDRRRWPLTGVRREVERLQHRRRGRGGPQRWANLHDDDARWQPRSPGLATMACHSAACSGPHRVVFRHHCPEKAPSSYGTTSRAAHPEVKPEPPGRRFPRRHRTGTPHRAPRSVERLVPDAKVGLVALIHGTSEPSNAAGARSTSSQLLGDGDAEVAGGVDERLVAGGHDEVVGKVGRFPSDHSNGCRRRLGRFAAGQGRSRRGRRGPNPTANAPAPI